MKTKKHCKITLNEKIKITMCHTGTSPVALAVRTHSPTQVEVRAEVSVPGSGRSPEEGMATHRNTPVRRIPQTEEPGGYNTWGHKESGTTEAT